MKTMKVGKREALAAGSSRARSFSRREVLLAILASAVSGAVASGKTDPEALQERLRQLEAESGGRLGVAMT
ncbi:MAG: hypothetical protein MI919_13620, partial [Holophagales bacterium]|nr:hypothetical protein [Holophagales bacterium]